MAENRHSRRALQRGRGGLAAAALPPLRQTLFLLFAFVALGIQSLVVQTHIHHRMAQLAPLTGIAVLSDVGASSPSADGHNDGPRDPFPGDDPNCTLCQALTHSGQFLHSAAVLAYIPAWISVHFIVFQDVLPSLLAVSHSWQGRAPPQH